MLRRDHQRVQQSGIPQLCFQQVPGILGQLRRKIDGLIERGAGDAPHGQLYPGGVGLRAPGRRRLRLVPETFQLPVTGLPLLLQIVPRILKPELLRIPLALQTADALVHQIADSAPVRP